MAKDEARFWRAGALFCALGGCVAPLTLWLLGMASAGAVSAGALGAATLVCVIIWGRSSTAAHTLSEAFEAEAKTFAAGDSDELQHAPAVLNAALKERFAAEHDRYRAAEEALAGHQAVAKDAQMLAQSVGGEVAFITYDQQGRAQHISEAAAAFFPELGDGTTEPSHEDLFGTPLPTNLPTTRDVELKSRGAAKAPRSFRLRYVRSDHSDTALVIVDDVTGENALKNAAEISRQSFDALPTAAIMLDAEGMVIGLNKACTAAAAAESFLAEVCPDLRIGERFAFGTAVNLTHTDLALSDAEESKALEIRHQQAVIKVGVHRADASGHHLVTFEDVTDNQAAESISHGVRKGQIAARFDAEGRFIWVSDALIASTGFEAQHLLGAHHDDVFARKSDTGSDTDHLWSGVQRGDVHRGTYARQTSSGETLWLAGSYVQVRDHSGEVYEVCFVANDVTSIVTAADDNEAASTALSMGYIVVQTSPDGKVIAANESAQSTLGGAGHDIVGVEHSSFMADDEENDPFTVLREGRIVSGKMKRRALDGREVVLRANYCPVVGSSGAIEKVLLIASDVTAEERERAEMVSNLSLFNSSDTPIVLVDREAKVVDFNASAEHFFSDGSDGAGVLDNFGKSLIGQSLPLEVDEAPALFSAISSGQGLPMTAHISSEGRTISVNASPLSAEDGSYIGAATHWSDVTQSVGNAKVLDALTDNQIIIELTPDGLVAKANNVFLDLVGYNENEVLQQHHRMFVDFNDTSEADYESMWSMLQDGVAKLGRFRLVSKAGDPVYLQGSYIPILDAAGDVHRIIHTATDVTLDEEETRLAKVDRLQRIDDQAMVLGHLTAGLKRLASGDLSVEIKEQFPPDYMQLRHDFNDAVAKLAQTEKMRVKLAEDQDSVVSELATALQKLSTGVLTFELSTELPPEYEELRINFNQAIGRMRSVMQAIARTATGLSKGSSEISQAADDLSKRTENQAATLEETAAALDEITATVRLTADGATEANRVASETRGEATASGEVVRNAVAAMGEIEQSSTQISQIIGVIDDIAFQTNLLALNAGVEAARAGDAGRGFAVVAQEVRALAQRSSEAAKEIKELISTSSEQVSRGVELVDRAGNALGDIVARVENVSTLVSEIASSAQEQSVSLGEVNSAMNKMDQVTQQNAAMVEQSTASSHALARASTTLIDQIAHFDAGIDGQVKSLEDVLSEPVVKDDEADVPTDESGLPVREQREAAKAFFAGVGGAAEDLSQEDENWEEF